MSGSSLPTVGLTIAALMVASNGFTDVARKKAVQHRTLIPTTLWCQVFAAMFFGAVLLIRVMGGAEIAIRGSGALFGISALTLPPGVVFAVYLILDVLLVSVANLLYFQALRVSPLSLSIPFLAFTPVFMLPVGLVMLDEWPQPIKLIGVFLIVCGSVLMYRKVLAKGWSEPFKAIFHEKGSWYILLVSFIFAFTNPLEKKLVLMSDSYTMAFLFGVGLSLFFLILAVARHEDWLGALRGNIVWTGVAGGMDGVSLLLQYACYYYIDVVIAVSIKRTSIVLAVFFGWLFFRERGITDKVIGSSVMLAGVLILYLPVTATQASVLTLVTLALGFLALRLTAGRQRVAVDKRGAAV